MAKCPKPLPPTKTLQGRPSWDNRKLIARMQAAEAKCSHASACGVNSGGGEQRKPQTGVPLVRARRRRVLCSAALQRPDRSRVRCFVGPEKYAQSRAHVLAGDS